MTKTQISLLAIIFLPLAVTGCASSGTATVGLPMATELPSCPETPNCVSSQAEDEEHQIEPLPFEGDGVTALRELQDIIEGLPRTEIVEVSERALHATFKSRLLRFVDDVHLVVDPKSSVLHVRSASRVGRSDFGANRRRVENLRQQWNSDKSGER